jgi:glycosyltransferase involved in cell wall biosynthesis
MAQGILNARQLSSSLCRERAEQRFSAERMISEYLSLYEGLAHTTESAHWEKVA